MRSVTVECPHCGHERRLKITSLRARSWKVPPCRSCSSGIAHAKKKITDPNIETLTAPCGKMIFEREGRCADFFDCEHQGICLMETGKRHWEGWGIQ